MILGDRWPLWIWGWGSRTYVADCPYQTLVVCCKTSSESDDQHPRMPMAVVGGQSPECAIGRLTIWKKTRRHCIITALIWPVIKSGNMRNDNGVDSSPFKEKSSYINTLTLYARNFIKILDVSISLVYCANKPPCLIVRKPERSLKISPKSTSTY